MRKVKITADGILEIIKGVLKDSDIDTIDEPSQKNIHGKSIQEFLNVDYYTFKHRPESTEQIIKRLEDSGVKALDELGATKRGFCIFTMEDRSREPAKDIDVFTVEGTLDFWVQTEKVKFVENLVERCNTELTGMYIPVEFPEINTEAGLDADKKPIYEKRKMAIVFDTLEVGDLDNTLLGETQQVAVGVTMLFNPNIAGYSDYTFEFGFELKEKEVTVDGQTKTVIAPDYIQLPLLHATFGMQMVADGVPLANQSSTTGTVNLSRGRTLKIDFEGHDNRFVDYMVDDYTYNEEADNNAPIYVRRTRKGVVREFIMVAIAHQIDVTAGPMNEINTISFAERGL